MQWLVLFAGLLLGGAMHAATTCGNGISLVANVMVDMAGGKFVKAFAWQPFMTISVV